MKPLALAHARGDGYCPEYEAWVLVNNFGAEAVFGRQLYIDEMFGMLAARGVVEAWYSRKSAQDEYKWIDDHPQQQAMIDDAVRLEIQWQTE